MPENSDEKVESYIGRMKAYYKPQSIRERAKMVSYILAKTHMRYSELAQTIQCSTGHISELKFLAENLTDDELDAIDDLGIGVHTAYQKYKFRT